ncbi:unnamed protein product [Zymoseptoria tritici ST99CH_3D7]|uniref:Uncharacterized protein n=1 Tax=Zymoseptoria tritici (strain ST99CH_3D7) TaxID=1276538 RepID=A0A1X7RUZ9_ZYMT9|nr:unnamed protein product [Zymoseptoria tritici ST99CH_3D7]
MFQPPTSKYPGTDTNTNSTRKPTSQLHYTTRSTKCRHYSLLRLPTQYEQLAIRIPSTKLAQRSSPYCQAGVHGVVTLVVHVEIGAVSILQTVVVIVQLERVFQRELVAVDDIIDHLRSVRYSPLSSEDRPSGVIASP